MRIDTESFEHLLIKKYLFDNLPLVNDILKIEQEYSIGNRKADIYLELSTHRKIVIEIQHSVILKKELLKRTKDYNNKDCYVLWIFNGNSFGRSSRIEYPVQIYNFESISHILYKNRVYFINVSSTGIIATIYPLHFAPFYEIKQKAKGISYIAKSKLKKSTIPGSISSLRLITLEYEGYKLARFSDDSVRTECKLVLKDFLSKYRDIKQFSRNEIHMTANEKKLYIIITKFASVYGIHLLYDILKGFGQVEKKDFIFMKLSYDYLKESIKSCDFY